MLKRENFLRGEVSVAARHKSECFSWCSSVKKLVLDSLSSYATRFYKV